MDTNGRMSLYEDYVSFETAKLLKEKGFDVYVSSFYYNEGKFSRKEADWNWNIGPRYSAPTLQMAMKWLRQVHIVFIDIHSYWLIHKTFSNNGFRVEISCSKLRNEYLEQTFDTYEEACEAAIKYCLENLI